MSMPEKQLLLEKSYNITAWGDSVRGYTGTLLLAVVDYVAVVGSILTVWYLRDQILPHIIHELPPFEISQVYTFFIIPSIYLLFLAYEGLYTKRLPFVQCAELVFKIVTYVSIFFVMLLYFLQEHNVSRLFILLTWLCSLAFLLTARYFTKRVLIACSLWEKAVVIIGAGKTAELLTKSFVAEPGMGYKIVGLIEDNIKDRPLLQQYPHLGSFANAEQAIRDSGVQEAIIAVPGLERKQLLELVYRVQPYVRNLTIVPDLFGMPLSNMQVETLFSEKTVMLSVRNNLALLRNRAIKRFFDIFVGIPVFVAILPLLFILTVLIKCDSKGAAFYNAKRLGKDGKEFLCYKFRTMYTNSDEILQQYLADNAAARGEWNQFAKLRGYDPRVTPVGKWMRKLSLDELPQIINVIKGEMSLVGPRPYLPREREMMGYFISIILQTNPGITGLWQVSGRNEIDFDGRLQLDEWYVRNWSLWHDIALLFKTVNVVLVRKGAY